MMTDDGSHECCSGYVYSETTMPSGEIIPVVRPCVQCAVERVRRRVPRSCASGWEHWEEVKELAGCVAVLREWRGDPWCVLLHAAEGKSNVGSGKTTAAWAVAIEFAKTGKDTVFWQAAELAEAYRAAAMDERPMPVIRSNELLIIDDLGQERETSMAAEQIELLVDKRWKVLAPTLVTTNLTLMALAERYPRAYSRMQQGYRLPWSAPDFRAR